jgi:hypothetical protein
LQAIADDRSTGLIEKSADQKQTPYPILSAATLGLFSVPAPPFHASGRRGFFVVVVVASLPT